MFNDKKNIMDSCRKHLSFSFFLITIGVKIFNDDDNSSLGKNKV
jgi:hypothetical protein